MNALSAIQIDYTDESVIKQRIDTIDDLKELLIKREGVISRANQYENASQKALREETLATNKAKIDEIYDEKAALLGPRFPDRNAITAKKAYELRVLVGTSQDHTILPAERKAEPAVAAKIVAEPVVEAAATVEAAPAEIITPPARTSRFAIARNWLLNVLSRGPGKVILSQPLAYLMGQPEAEPHLPIIETIRGIKVPAEPVTPADASIYIPADAAVDNTPADTATTTTEPAVDPAPQAFTAAEVKALEEYHRNAHARAQWKLLGLDDSKKAGAIITENLLNDEDYTAFKTKHNDLFRRFVAAHKVTSAAEFIKALKTARDQTPDFFALTDDQQKILQKDLELWQPAFELINQRAFMQKNGASAAESEALKLQVAEAEKALDAHRAVHGDLIKGFLAAHDIKDPADYPYHLAAVSGLSNFDPAASSMATPGATISIAPVDLATLDAKQIGWLKQYGNLWRTYDNALAAGDQVLAADSMLGMNTLAFEDMALLAGFKMASKIRNVDDFEGAVAKLAPPVLTNREKYDLYMNVTYPAQVKAALEAEARAMADEKAYEAFKKENEDISRTLARELKKTKAEMAKTAQAVRDTGGSFAGDADGLIALVETFKTARNVHEAAIAAHDADRAYKTSGAYTADLAAHKAAMDASKAEYDARQSVFTRTRGANHGFQSEGGIESRFWDMKDVSPGAAAATTATSPSPAPVAPAPAVTPVVAPVPPVATFTTVSTATAAAPLTPLVATISAAAAQVTTPVAAAAAVAPVAAVAEPVIAANEAAAVAQTPKTPDARDLIANILKNMPDEKSRQRATDILTKQNAEDDPLEWPLAPYHYGQGRNKAYEDWLDTLSKERQEDEKRAAEARTQGYYTQRARTFEHALQKEGLLPPAHVNGFHADLAREIGAEVPEPKIDMDQVIEDFRADLARDFPPANILSGEILPKARKPNGHAQPDRPVVITFNREAGRDDFSIGR